MCQSQLRAIMSADDQFAATMQLLSDRGVLDNTLVILSSDNGYMWGEHGRWEKFVPYEPSIHVPSAGPLARPLRRRHRLHAPRLLARPAPHDARGGWDGPAHLAALDGESLLRPSRRTPTYGEYYVDGANPRHPSGGWCAPRRPSTRSTTTRPGR